jgi:aquaporin Z
MEGTEVGILMLSSCIWGALTYSDESPLKFLGLSAVSKSILMGTAVAMTPFLIIRSPFGRRSGAHLNRRSH